jgi:hypothetical protein
MTRLVHNKQNFRELSCFSWQIMNHERDFYCLIVLMKKVALLSSLLISGIILAQFLPQIFGELFPIVDYTIRILTLVGLSFIMIHVGYEFEIVKSAWRSYAWDYVVAMTAAAFPWIFVTLYFLFVMFPMSLWGNWELWKELSLAGRYAAPTSAGVLFSMMAAAGLGATWTFHKARILAIFDDLDTILLMIPLKMMLVGFAWQLGVIVLIMFSLLWMAWRFLHLLNLPKGWLWVIGYSVAIVVLSELISVGAGMIDDEVPFHIEVLLPAFVLGTMTKTGRSSEKKDREESSEKGQNMENIREHQVETIVSALFMLLVGLSMAPIFASADIYEKDTITAQQPALGWDILILHVLIVTLLLNLGKMFPFVCYRKEATWKERLALSISMWPRGEVGAGVLMISVSYSLGGPIITVAALSLALNLVLTGGFIWFVKKLLNS